MKISYEICQCEECIIYRFVIIDDWNWTDKEKETINQASHEVLKIMDEMNNQMEK